MTTLAFLIFAALCATAYTLTLVADRLGEIRDELRKRSSSPNVPDETRAE